MSTKVSVSVCVCVCVCVRACVRVLQVREAKVVELLRRHRDALLQSERDVDMLTASLHLAEAVCTSADASTLCTRRRSHARTPPATPVSILKSPTVPAAVSSSEHYHNRNNGNMGSWELVDRDRSRVGVARSGFESPGPVEKSGRGAAEFMLRLPMSEKDVTKDVSCGSPTHRVANGGRAAAVQNHRMLGRPKESKVHVHVRTLVFCCCARQCLTRAPATMPTCFAAVPDHA